MLSPSFPSPPASHESVPSVAPGVLLAAAVLLLAGPSPGSAQVDARMFRFPDVSDSQVTFVYGGDVWVVSKDGGAAHRLSTPAGEEIFPRFSPDGSRIAFSGNYDGNADVYVVPARGGVAERVTWHPEGDRLVDWTPGGSALLVASPRSSGVERYDRLFRIPADGGGLAQRLPVPYGEFGDLAPDGRRLAYTPKSRSFRTWKRYRGGMAPDIWLFDLQSLESEKLAPSPANDEFPMWHGETLYFLSDRGPAQRHNLWALELDAGEPRQVTTFTEFDVTWPAIGPSDIVFQAGGRLHLMDLETEQVRALDVDVVTDRATLRPRTENVGRMIRDARISPSGKRAVFQARGEIFTVPAEHGPIRALTRSSGTGDRYPAWSPDGTRVAWWSDRTGEYELTVRDASGRADAETVTSLGPGYRYRLFWSPDSRRVAFIDHTQTIHIYDFDTGETTRVDQGLWRLHGGLQSFEARWSPDSRWLAWDRGLETGGFGTAMSAVFLYDTETGEKHRVTSGYFSDSSPVFDPDGEYLYYLSNRHLEPVYSDVDVTWVYPNTTKVVAVPLRSEVASPLAPRNEEEPADGGEGEPAGEERDGGEGRDGGDGAGGDGDDEPARVEIQLEGFESRAVVLPPEAGNYGDLQATSGKILYRRLPRNGSTDEASPILYWDLEEREEGTILADADGYELSADGKKILATVNGAWHILPAQPEQQPKEPLATRKLETTVDPRSEWRQIFHEVWRTYRDYFYDPDMHGLDWPGLREHYGALLEDAVTRWDVNWVIGQLIGEVNASHTYVGGGDVERAERRGVGLLGVDWELADGAWRIERILEAAAWDAEARSPLAESGVEVSAGDWVLAVNGRPLVADRPPHAAFEGLAGETVVLTVNDAPDTEGAREVVVETLESDDELRYRMWVEENRRRVADATDGRVGYVHVPNTAVSGQTELVRQFRSQVRKEGLIVDERFNAGGQLPDRFIELVTRRLVNLIHFRHGGTVVYPTVSHYGPKAMLINGWAGSGGDAYPYFWRTLEVGPLVGERTWGGLIGPAVGHQLIDGGFYTAPPGRIYGPDGEWFAEGHGVEPDVRVEDDPSALARGTDPQLQAAIRQVMEALEENPPSLPEPPPYEERVPEGGVGGAGGSGGGL